MRYEVGDKVRVRKDLVVDKAYDGYVFARSMEEFKGKIVTIESVDCDCYFIKEDKFEFKYGWVDEMLEPIKVVTNWDKVEWISTKDRLPREGEYVLINSRTYISDFLETIFAVAYLDNGWWRDSWFDRQIALETDKDITHWAELPELPQEE